MTSNDRSEGCISYVPMMLDRDAERLPWLRGTPLGRLVVPDVCRNRATSSGFGGSCLAAPKLGRCEFPPALGLISRSLPVAHTGMWTNLVQETADLQGSLLHDSQKAKTLAGSLWHAWSCSLMKGSYAKPQQPVCIVMKCMMVPDPGLCALVSHLILAPASEMSMS